MIEAAAYFAFVMTSVVFTFAYLFTWVKFQKYQFLERNKEITNKFPEISALWHLWKGANQIVWFLLIGLFFGLKIMFLNMVFFWIMFDGLINKMVLDREFFYIGTTAFIDKSFHTISTWWNNTWLNKITKNRFPMSPIVLSALLKIILLFISLKIVF